MKEVDIQVKWLLLVLIQVRICERNTSRYQDSVEGVVASSQCVPFMFNSNAAPPFIGKFAANLYQ